MVAELQRLGEVVGDEDHRLADLVVEAEDLVLHVAADQRVEGAERLVEEHDLGVDGEGPGQADPLLHAARQLVRVALARDPRARRGRIISRARLRGAACGFAADLEAERDVVDDPPVWQQAEVLEDHAEPVPSQLAQPSLVHLDDVVAVEQDLARGRLDEPGQAADERGLAAARQAHDDEDLAGPDIE